MKILLIAGHGNGDSGACGNGYREADLTREVVALLKARLNNICDAEVADMSKDWFEYLGTHGYDFTKYDYVLEIHFNSGGGTGTEIFVTTSEKGVGVETAIVQQISNAVGYRNRGVKRTNFRVISRVKAQGVSAALLEVCFIDNADDVNTYQNRKNDIINAVVNGIAEGFGLEQETPTHCPGRYYPLEEMKNYESEENDMATHEDLQNKIEELERRLEKLETPMIYNYIDKNMPEWAHEAVKWCVDKGIVKGVGDGKLGLDDNKLWQCVTLYRFAQHIGNALNMKF